MYAGRKCKACLRVLARSDFYENKHSPGGYMTTCRKCQLLAQKNRLEAESPEKKAERSAYFKNYYQSHRDKHIENSRRWLAANREKAYATSKRWADKNRERLRENARKRHLRERDKDRYKETKRKYGLDRDAFYAMLASQSNGCAICKSALVRPVGTRAKPSDSYIDHDHSTKRVRGILCARCNTVLGYMRETVSNYQDHIDYLRKHKVCL